MQRILFIHKFKPGNPESLQRAKANPSKNVLGPANTFDLGCIVGNNELAMDPKKVRSIIQRLHKAIVKTTSCCPLKPN